IQSAGESSRMGQPKALLPIDGETFIERIVGVLQKTKIGRVFVILGHNAAELSRRVEHLPIEILINPNYKLGQLSSLQVAVRRIEQNADCDGMLVHLVDHPFIDARLVDTMIDRFYESNKFIVVPRHGGKRGHPVIFSRRLYGELLTAPLDQGAKVVVNAHQGDTLEIETDDIGITIDIDTPELYRQHVKGD
ncbi:MAG: nucleotidyltransferase family protein, partial [Candidatus Binatia bacterium]